MRLEENYRSTQVVLDAANGVIAENTGRIGKTLATRRRGGEPVTLLAAADERDEAEWVVRELAAPERRGRLELRATWRCSTAPTPSHGRWKRRSGGPGIPYRLIGAISFYERREVKDLLAYLRLVANPSDDEAFLRAVGVPRRGLGETSLAIARPGGHARGASRCSTPRAVPIGSPSSGPTCGKRSATSPRSSTDWPQRAGSLPPAEVLEQLIRAIDYEAVLLAEGPEGADRWENVRELVASAADWSEEVTEEAEAGTPLERFLAEAALLSSADTVDGQRGWRHPHDAAHRQGARVAGRGADRAWSTDSFRSPARRSSPTASRRSGGSATSG